MRFRTEYIASEGQLLSVERPVTLLGSCFAQNLTAKMRNSLWDAENPCGVLFNPLSIARLIRLALKPSRDEISGSVLIGPDGLWHSYLLDSSVSRPDRGELEIAVDETVKRLGERLAGSQALIVTFGSSNCYFEAAKRDSVVSNCHKMPESNFLRRRVSIKEITDDWTSLLEELHSLFPGLRIIFTVSPVRHLRDGLHENQLSKAVLQLAIEQLCLKFDFAEYFPAYELLLDDLRDYRFYASDLAHPSDQAVEYIWEKFLETYVDRQGKTLLREGGKLRALFNHRPIISAATESYQRFKEETEQRLRSFKSLHPMMLIPNQTISDS